MNQKKQKPPFFANLLFRLFSPRVDKFFLSGDFKEIYFYTLETEGRFAAWRWYWGQIIKSVPYFISNTFIWSIAMFKNYLKISLRSIRKRKVHSFINIVGLAVGLACSILIFLWVQDELSYDRFHKNGDQLFGAYFSNGSPVTPPPLADYLKNEYAEIKKSSRFNGLGRIKAIYKDKEFMESGGVLVDPEFLEMFTLNFIEGDPNTALSEPLSVVISQTFAEKYFGQENAFGKAINLRGIDCKVNGIFEDYPLNSHIYFDYLIPFTTLAELGRDLSSWNGNWHRTYVQVQENASIPEINKKIAGIVSQHRKSELRDLSLWPITKIHLYYFHGGGAIYLVYAFSAIAFIILLIACINFMNLVTAQSSIRTKEVGLRKTIGAFRSDLIKQFFGEALVLTFISLLVGIILTILFLPEFNSLTGKHFSINILRRGSVLFGILGIAIITGLLAGSYPALFLSSFQPIKILRRTIGSGTKSSAFRKVLVVVQFSLSIALIISTIILYKQINFMRTMSLGFDKDYVVTTWMNSRLLRQFDTFKNELKQNPNIINITSTNVPPYRWESNAGLGSVHWEGQEDKKIKMVMTSVEYDYLKTFGLEIVQGRFFSREYSSDISEGFVVNEAAVRAMGMDSPIGKYLKIWDLEGKIIGVLKDYHFESLQNEIIPMAMRIIPNWNNDLCIKIQPHDIQSTLQFIEKKWKAIYPEYPFEYNFLDDQLNNLYLSEERIGVLFRYFTSIAIIISCLGLFGLASFLAEERTKEVGIRKVLGASIPGLMILLSKDFIKWVLVANLFAWPLAWYTVSNWLKEYAYKTDVSLPVFILSGCLALLIAFVTVSYQTIKAASSNPTDSLKYE